MARRRAPAAPAPATDELPPELEDCHVEDWLGPWERPPPAWCAGTINGTPAVQVAEEVELWFVLTARRRWTEARARWAAEAHLDPETLPAGRPRWRGLRPTDQGDDHG